MLTITETESDVYIHRIAIEVDAREINTLKGEIAHDYYHVCRAF